MEEQSIYDRKGCTLVYKISKPEEKIQLFGEKFCSNNSNICKMNVNGEEKEINIFYQNKKEKFIIVQLIMDENIADLSYMFTGCSTLLSISNISKWNTKNITKMKYMFFECKSLISLPDISKWDLMLLIFNLCFQVVNYLNHYLIYQNGIQKILII